MSSIVLAYHEMGCTGLRALLRHGAPVSAVFTYADDPDENCWFGSVAEMARAAGVPVIITETINDERWVRHIAELAPDTIFSFYYRHIVGRAIRAIPRWGSYNLHGSLLPRYRGRSPLNWQLVHGERESGVTLHVMTGRADAGDIVGQERVAVGPDETALELYTRLNAAADVLLDRHLGEVLAGRAPCRAQDESQASVFGGRRPEDGRIDWRWSRARVHDLVRAVAPPWPGAFAELSDGRLLVFRASLPAAPTAPPAPPAPNPSATSLPSALRLDVGQVAPGQIALRQGRVFVGAADGPVELLAWRTPSDRPLRDGEQLSVGPPPVARQEMHT